MVKELRPGIAVAVELQYCNGESVVGTVIKLATCAGGEYEAVNAATVLESAQAHVGKQWETCMVTCKRTGATKVFPATQERLGDWGSVVGTMGQEEAEMAYTAGAIVDYRRELITNNTL